MVAVEELNLMLTQLDFIEIDKEAPKGEIEEVRRLLNSGKAKLQKLLKDTSTSEALTGITDSDAEHYIKDVLSRALILSATELKFDKRFEEVQDYKCFASLIHNCVEESELSLSKFKIKHLQSIRSKVENSKTLRELRVWTKLLVQQLEFYYSITDEAETIQYLTSEIDRLNKLADERKRVLDEILGVYNEDLSELDLLRMIEGTKVKTNCSDDEVVKIYAISRSKLVKMRKQWKSC